MDVSRKPLVVANHTKIDLLLQKYPNRVPVRITLKDDLRSIRMDTTRFMASSDLKFSEFLIKLRRESAGEIGAGEALFGFVNGRVLVPSNARLGELYHTYKTDQVLDILIFKENTFGLGMDL